MKLVIFVVFYLILNISCADNTYKMRLMYIKYETQNNALGVSDAHKISIELFPTNETVVKIEADNTLTTFIYYEYFKIDKTLDYAVAYQNLPLNERYKKFLPEHDGTHEYFSYVAWTSNSNLTCSLSGNKRLAVFYVKYFNCITKASEFYDEKNSLVENMVLVSTIEIDSTKKKGNLSKHLNTNVLSSC